MTNSLQIGKVIYEKLSQSEKLKEMVGDNIFPLIADNDTKFPFIVYKRLTVSDTGTKDGYGEDEVSYEVTVLHDRYAPGVDIANECRRVLERQRVVSDLMTLYNNRLIGVSEDYDANTYIQKLTFSCTIN